MFRMVGFHYQDAASAAVMMYQFSNWNHWCLQPFVDMDVSKNRGTPKWMVYNGKPLLKWMIWRAHPYFRKHPHGTIGINGVSDSFEQFHSRMSDLRSAIELPEVFGTKVQSLPYFHQRFSYFLKPVIYVISRYGLKLVWISVVTRFPREKRRSSKWKQYSKTVWGNGCT